MSYIIPDELHDLKCIVFSSANRTKEDQLIDAKVFMRVLVHCKLYTECNIVVILRYNTIDICIMLRELQ